MSHRATNWAIQQRGLPPATKLVLWHLCDRHNPDYGCFPSQDQLAADVEISRASLNTHLDRLERAGLIRRERRLDEIHRQKSTRYFLGFEDDFPSGGGGEDANDDLADDPDPLADPEAACLAACGPGLCPASRAQITGTGSVIAGWLGAGYELAADILPTLAERTVSVRISPIRTWDYFTAAIAERHARRMAHGASRGVAGERGKGSTGSAYRLTRHPTGPSPIPASGDVVDMVAGWIAEGRFVPPSAVSGLTRAALIARGLATEAQLRALQIY